MIYAQHCPPEVVERLRQHYDQKDQVLANVAKAIVSSDRFSHMMKCWWMAGRTNLNLTEYRTVEEWERIMQKYQREDDVDSKEEESRSERLARAQDRIVVVRNKRDEMIATVRLTRYAWDNNQDGWGNQKGSQNAFKIEILKGGEKLARMTATARRKAFTNAVHSVYPAYVTADDHSIWQLDFDCGNPRNLRNGEIIHMRKLPLLD